MSNVLVLAGAQPQSPTRFAPIYTGRWHSGLCTNRSPLRDATTTRMVEKFYGPAGDALIAGTNTEITTRLTLARRPGNSVFDSNTWNAVDRFYDFRVFSSTQEQIRVMIDQATALYSLYAGTQTLLWNKSTGAGQTYMQSVGNTLYFANGVDNKKWLQSLVTWSPSSQWNTTATPNFSTFLIDPNGNIQQLVATSLAITGVNVTNNSLVVTCSGTVSSVLSVGMLVQFPPVMSATFLQNQIVSVTAVTATTFTANFTNPNYSGSESGVYAVEITGGSANPTSGTSEPVWSKVVPSASNNFQGGITQDNQVTWVNRGNPVMNWGIQPGKTAPSTTLGNSNSAWSPNTFYSSVSVVVDSNGNLQQVTTAGKSGGAAPVWATAVGSTTTDGTAVWTMIQTAASLQWSPNTAYTQSVLLNLTSVAQSSGGSTVYSGAITGGASNAYVGKTFVISGWSHVVNNGSFQCTASTDTTITLSNPNGVAETRAASAKVQGSFVVGNASGVSCLFELAQQTQPSLTGSVEAYLYPGNSSGAVGCFTLRNPTSTGSAQASYTTLNSLQFTGTPLSNGAALSWDTINSAGEVTGSVNPFPGATQNYQLIILATLNVPVAGSYTFTCEHHDGMIWGMGNGATCASGTSDNPITPPQTVTAAQGYPIFGGTNRGLGGGGQWNDTFTVNFPTAGQYPIEVNYAYWYHSGQDMIFKINGFPISNSSSGSGNPTSGTNQPSWPEWSVTYAPNYPTVTESNGQLTWSNIGPLTDFAWAPSANFTLPNTSVIDANGYGEGPYRTGISGKTAPAWATGANKLTDDNPNLIWINLGTVSIPKTGTVSTYNGGWKYCVALVNSLDDTVTNASQLTSATGNFVGTNGVQIAPGSGLPNASAIDPQCDYVAVFRTTDGNAVPFLVPGQITKWTVPLATYLQSGYLDQTPDTSLNNLIQAPLNLENTPPAAGAVNLTYHLGRLWYSIGNVVYWTSGPDSPAGNGVNGTPPLNYDTFPSTVKRIVPTAVGAFVFTVSDVYIIQGSATPSSPIQPGVPIMKGVGLLGYNALDVNGSIIGFFTTDNQFCIFDPSGMNDYAGFPIGDQFRMNNGLPGQSWNPANVYVTWYVNGEDQGWFVSDGQYGWYRLLATPAPEQGYAWSPFATIVGGVKAVQSIEVTPGVRQLLLGPTGNGPILKRDLSTSQDNGQNYNANAVIGSAVLAQPGQVATIAFITTESVRTGTPMSLGVLLDEALPYYTGPFDVLKVWESDPPGLKASQSFYAQRFYLSELREAAACRHLQIKVQWAAENWQNELSSLTVFGAFFQEQ